MDNGWRAYDLWMLVGDNRVMPARNPRIDLNADVGESFGRWSLGEDEALLPLVTSANVACGFHAGDPATLLHTCRLAAAHGVSVGAQVGYRDLAGFGRRFVDVDPEELAAEILYQIGALDGIARSVGTRVAYVKPHGALYNTVVTHEEQAGAVVAGIAAYGALPVLGLPGSALHTAAATRGLPVVAEAFADRAYAPNGTLVPRSQPDAIIDDPDAIAARVVRLVTTGRVTAINGSQITVEASSVCLHGDTTGAVAIARAVRVALDGAGVVVRSFIN